MAQKRSNQKNAKVKTTSRTAKKTAARTSRTKAANAKTPTATHAEVVAAGEAASVSGPAPALRTGRALTRSERAIGVIPAGEPTDDQIRERAYLLYEARGGVQGDPVADWLLAERQLKAEARTRHS